MPGQGSSTGQPSPYWMSGNSPWQSSGIWGPPAGFAGSNLFDAPPGLLSAPPPLQIPNYAAPPPPMKTGVAALPPGTQIPAHVTAMLASANPAASSFGKRIIQQMQQRPGWQPRQPGGMGGNMGGYRAAAQGPY